VPFVSPEDSQHACNAALRIMESLESFNKERVSEGLMPIKMGIGINTGETLSGNIGSEKRMEFSHIGDAVNLASRTEGLTKYYGVEILITEFTYQETVGFLVREIDIGKLFKSKL
jgi:adenylate cyclase